MAGKLLLSSVPVIAAKQRNMMLNYNYIMRRPCILLPLAISLNRKTEARIVINQKTEVKDEFPKKRSEG
jgi:hypothetical protein